MLAALLVAATGVAQAQTARIVLRWKDVPGATGYELQIAKDSAFVEMVLQTRTTTAGYRWEQLPSVMHWWRVRSFDPEGRPSEWSPARTIAVDTAVPMPLTPADGEKVACGQAVALTLEGSPLIKEYIVQLGSTADLQGARELRGKSPAFIVPGLAAGTWYWQAHGVDLRGKTSSPAPLRSFVVQVAAPRLTPVSDTTIGNVVTLSWTAVTCAQSYLGEASVDNGERTNLPSQGTSLVFKPGSPGEYRWRVTGRDGSGGLGDWSGESVFKVRLPSPSPREELVSTKAELSWQPVTGATSYRVELSPARDFKPATAVQSATVTATSWRTADLKPGEWTWRVVAKDAAGHSSLPSEARRFNVVPQVPLVAPDFVAPAADVILADGRELDVSWSPVPQATRYEVELDGAALPVVRASTVRLPSVAPGAHQLRVRAFADPFRESPWSEARDFFVGVPPVARLTVEQVGHEVRVALLDAKGRPVADARPEFSMRKGRLSTAELRDQRWVMQWDPPDRAGDVLIVTERSFHEERELPPPSIDRWTLAATGGGTFSGGAVSSPSAAVSLARRLPLLDWRLSLQLRAGVYRAASAAVVAEQPLSGAVWLVPVSLLAEWRQEVGTLTLAAGLGPSVQLAFVQVGPVREVNALPGLEVSASVARRLGPGSVLAEAGFLYARLDSRIARLNAGGFSARVGYALPFD